jgi:hypothetical protein
MAGNGKTKPDNKKTTEKPKIVKIADWLAIVGAILLIVYLLGEILYKPEQCSCTESGFCYAMKCVIKDLFSFALFAGLVLVALAVVIFVIHKLVVL